MEKYKTSLKQIIFLMPNLIYIYFFFYISVSQGGWSKDMEKHKGPDSFGVSPRLVAVYLFKLYMFHVLRYKSGIAKWIRISDTRFYVLTLDSDIWKVAPDLDTLTFKLLSP